LDFLIFLTAAQRPKKGRRGAPTNGFSGGNKKMRAALTALSCLTGAAGF